ncbi:MULTISPECIES: acyl-CoA carboxylase subunit epsilon [unclassified Blastococcus]
MKATDEGGPLQGARREPASGGEQGVLPPLLRVVKGEPTPAELAALTVVVAALSQRRTRRRPPAPVGAWASYGRTHRRPLQAGPGGWRAAGSPA